MDAISKESCSTEGHLGTGGYVCLPTASISSRICSSIAVNDVAFTESHEDLSPKASSRAFSSLAHVQTARTHVLTTRPLDSNQKNEEWIAVNDLADEANYMNTAAVSGRSSREQSHSVPMAFRAHLSSQTREPVRATENTPSVEGIGRSIHVGYGISICGEGSIQCGAGTS